MAEAVRTELVQAPLSVLCLDSFFFFLEEFNMNVTITDSSRDVGMKHFF